MSVSGGFFLYDDAAARRFQPFALTRPVGELRAGAELIRRRWEIALGTSCAGFLGAPHLSDFDEGDAPPARTDGDLPAGTVVANARCAPSLHPVPHADVWRCAGQIGAVRLSSPLPVVAFADGRKELSSITMPTARLCEVRGRWLEHVWDLVRHLAPMLIDDVAILSPGTTRAPSAPMTVLGAHDVVIEEGSTVEPFVVMDATAGPILVRRGARIAAFSRLVGPCVIGYDSHVLGGKLVNVSVGEHCRVHGEVSTTVFTAYANKGHDGFVGHSVLGRWVNLGASTVTSNLKNTYGTVQLWTPDGLRDTGLQFLGTLFGDHAKTAIGTRLTTGSLVGSGANVVTASIAPKVVPPFTWDERGTIYDLPRFLLVAERVMARRHVTLGERGRRLLTSAYEARWHADQ